MERYRIVFLLVGLWALVIITVSVWTFTTTASVRPGTNRLSCSPLENANEQGIKVSYASWQKRPGENHKWSWLGGVSDPNKHAEIGRPNGTDARYILHGANATLEIRNITKDDNDNEYMCTVRGEHGFRKSSIYKLSFFEPDESTSQNCTCPKTCNNCTHSTCNNTGASGAANETTIADSNETAYVTPLVVVVVIAVAEGVFILYRERSYLRALFHRCPHRAGTDAPN